MRLILTLTPIVCVMAAICISSVLEKQLNSATLEIDSIYTPSTTSEAYSILTEEKSNKVRWIVKFLSFLLILPQLSLLGCTFELMQKYVKLCCCLSCVPSEHVEDLMG